MTLKCQQCGRELPSFPKTAVENSRISEVVAHSYDPDDSLAVGKTDYYCNPECAARAFRAD